MRKVLASVLLLSLTTASAQTLAPFGIKQGMSVAELQKLGAKPGSTPGYYTLDKAPTPNDAFDFYLVKASPKQGVCRITGIGKNISDDGYGTKTRAAFVAMEKTLIAKYGPADRKDTLSGSATYTNPNEWLRSIDEDERDFISFWDLASGSKLPSNIDMIMLSTRAMDATTGYLSLSYRLKNADACDNELKSATPTAPAVSGSGL